MGRSAREQRRLVGLVLGPAPVLQRLRQLELEVVRVGVEEGERADHLGVAARVLIDDLAAFSRAQMRESSEF